MTISNRELAEEYHMHDFDSYESLFSSWYYKKVTPDMLEEGYVEMKPLYKKWLMMHGLMKDLRD